MTHQGFKSATEMTILKSLFIFRVLHRQMKFSQPINKELIANCDLHMNNLNLHKFSAWKEKHSVLCSRSVLHFLLHFNKGFEK